MPPYIKDFWEAVKGNRTPEMNTSARWVVGSTIVLILLLFF